MHTKNCALYHMASKNQSCNGVISCATGLMIMTRAFCDNEAQDGRNRRERTPPRTWVVPADEYWPMLASSPGEHGLRLHRGPKFCTVVSHIPPILQKDADGSARMTVTGLPHGMRKKACADSAETTRKSIAAGSAWGSMRSRRPCTGGCRPVVANRRLWPPEHTATVQLQH